MGLSGIAWMISSFAFGSDEYDELKEVGHPVRTDDEPSVGVLAKVVDGDGVFDGVEDVVVGNAVSLGGRVDLHTRLLYYKNRSAGYG